MSVGSISNGSTLSSMFYKNPVSASDLAKQTTSQAIKQEESQFNAKPLKSAEEGRKIDMYV